MTAYLVANPPRIRQYRRPRRQKASGVCVVHTAENLPDLDGVDGAAEAVAGFIVSRVDYGSYHDLCDSDSIVDLVPYDAEAYHDGTGSNPHSYGVSGATQAHRWPTLPLLRRRAIVRNMAKAAARYAAWLESTEGIVIPARRITREQSELLVPGFLAHGDRDPNRRTDPGKAFPWDYFLRCFRKFRDPKGTPRWDAIYEKADQIIKSKPAGAPGRAAAFKIRRHAKRHSSKY